MKKDYSEYELNEYEKYRYLRSGNQYARFDYFVNSASFNTENKTIFIRVDASNEYVRRAEDIAEDENFQTNGHPRPNYRNQQEADELEEIRQEGIAENEKDFAALCSRYDIDRSNFDMHAEYFYRDHPEEKEEPLNNVLSGSYIRISSGEGILDFIYADFKPAYQRAIKIPLLFSHFGEPTQEEQDEPVVANGSESHSESEKIYNQTQDIVQAYFRYMSTVFHVKDISYSSLYTAICPPVFTYDYETLNGLRWYYNYLITLQKEYRELLEFCFDEEFYPEVLGRLHPAERYDLYRHLHKQPSYISREETFELNTDMMSGHEMPYGLDADGMLNRLNTKIPNDDIHREFAKRYGMTTDNLDFYLRYPRFMNIRYEFRSVADILELEFSKILEQNIRFRKCRRCGKYFIMKGNYDTRYCDRIAPGEKRKCQDIAAQENYKQKNAGNEALPIYSKYYKRYAARVRVNQIKEADFKKWKYAALTKRDECSDGKITIEEFIEWLEASFPNRKKKV